VIDRVGAGELQPLPVTASPIASPVDAFRTMAAAEHVGKLVLTAAPAPVTVAAPAIRPGATYVITGGTGALGLATAGRLARNGATHLALVARRAPDATAAAAIAALTAAGATVRVVLADVGDPAALVSALDMVRAEMPPVRGAFHAAGVLADATLATMDATTLRDALAPKLDGAWNLHVATAADPLDHFVLYSSVAGVLGLRGQANYAAGNAFLDALAIARRAAALPALSIAWGPWLGVGLAAAAANRGDRLAESGLGGLIAGEALDVLDRLLDSPAPTAIVMRFDAAAWAEADPTAAALLDDMTGAVNEPVPDGSAEGRLAERLAAVPPGPRRRAVAEDTVCAQLAPVLRVAPERIDRQRTMKAMGLDSLMALELRNRLEAASGLTLSATAAWNHPTVALLAEHLAGRLGIALDATAPDADLASGGDTDLPAADPADTAPADAPADVSADELAAMLRDELAAVERLLDGNGAAS
jgi:NADP-dependent 3-hydroxy acid dehydrogenase YdfG/acyl carrier protein